MTIDELIRIIKRQRTEEGTKRHICRTCDFIFYTATFGCAEWNLHKQITGHKYYYNIPTEGA